MRNSPYSQLESVNGFVTYNMKSWDDFCNFINKHFLSDTKHYIWRGQENNEWLLESSLDRLLKKFTRAARSQLYLKHLSNFRYSIRGRCSFSSATLSDDDCWALGQHYGLATPLLDWTISPFIAAFFAINNIPNSYPNALVEGLNDKCFTIFALHRGDVEKKNKSLNEEQALKIIEPLFDWNPRLVSQGGLFTKIPISTDVESWVKGNFTDENDYDVLIKFNIPYKNIENTKNILMHLNRMNINHASLFPDLFGSSYYCNMKLAIPKY